VLWPAFRREHLFEAGREFQARDRRFGAAARHEGIPG
jgi:undecaprenyl pyrophosphate synthase